MGDVSRRAFLEASGKACLSFGASLTFANLLTSCAPALKETEFLGSGLVLSVFLLTSVWSLGSSEKTSAQACS